jgi:fucose permease
MAMVNVTPRRPSIIGIVIGACLLVVGAYLLWLGRDTLWQFIKIFAGFFLLLFGLGILTASAARRG